MPPVAHQLDQTGARRIRTSTVPGRLPSLDGLRGVAAVVVLLHHALLVVPSLGAVYYDTQSHPEHGSLTWWLVSTPLHVVWGGTEAVYVFFVLSGLVLTLPSVRGGAAPWRAYYPQRLVRLYVPVIVAVALGSVLALLVVRDPADAASAWLAARPTEVTAVGVAHDVTLVAGPSGVISPLWSLRWEVLFSLLLPVYVLVAVRGRRWWSVTAGLSLLAVAAGAASGFSPALYLAMFMIGSLMAAHLGNLLSLGRRLSAHQHAAWCWPALLAAALLLLSAHWLFRAGTPSRAEDGLRTLAVVVGAAVTVWVALSWPAARSWLSSRGVQWLGRISFSLYLVHEPIVIAVGFLLGRGHEILVTPIAVVVALPLAAVFARWVERPSHLLARRLVRRLAPGRDALSQHRTTDTGPHPSHQSVGSRHVAPRR